MMEPLEYDIEHGTDDQRSDREILLDMAKDIRDAKEFMASVESQVRPLLDKISEQPMLRMLLGGGK